MKKPPLGLVPKEYCAEYRTRFHDVGNAINRYLLHSEYIEIPIEWVNEYNSLCEILKKDSLRTTHNKDCAVTQSEKDK